MMDFEDQEDIPPQCYRCLFFNQYDEKGATCKAFPDGIPLKYLGGNPHNEVVKGQVGVYTFVPNLEEVKVERPYYQQLCVELYPLTKEICKLVGTEKANLIRRYIIGWLGTRKLKQELCVDMPIDTSEHEIRDFRKSLERAQRSDLKKHERCEICGESRISDKCHIWPNAHGGSSDEDNMIYLCPTHHFLFDHYRLSKEEWSKLDFSNRPEPIKNI